MPDSVLTMCQDVTNEIGTEPIAAVIGNNNDTARRLLQAAQRTGNGLARAHTWTLLQREHTFTTVDSQAAYDLPSDFDRMLPHTQWDRANEWRLLGPLSPQEWQLVKSGVVEEGPRRDYRIKPDSGTNKFFISPTPGSGEGGETLVFEYISANWAETSGGTGISKFQNDDDVPRFDDELFRLGIKWRFLRTLGLDYITEYDEYERMFNRRVATDGDMSRLRMDQSFNRENALYANIADGNFPSS